MTSIDKEKQSGLPSESPWRIWAALGIVVLAVCVAYSNSLHGPFVFDDAPSIIANRSIRQLWSPQVLAAPPEAVTTTGRPVVNLTLAINYAIGELAVEGYHVVNIVLHLLAALTLFGVVRRTLLLPSLSARYGTCSTELALVVALFWAVHPLQTESVTYIVQRAEAIVGLFYLLTLYGLVRGATAVKGRAWYAAAWGACALGMASKEVMVSAPLVALLYDGVFITGAFKESWHRRRRLWLALAATWILLAFVFLLSGSRGGSAGFGLGMTVWEYARTQFGCIIHYLRLVFWPDPLVLDYGYPIANSAAEIVPYAIAVFVLMAATAVALIRRPKVGFLGVAFFAILAPTSSIVPLAGQTEAEHRMYLPLATVVILVVLVAHGILGRSGYKKVAYGLVPVVALALGWRTYQRNKDYQSELTLWDKAAAHAPLNDRAYLSRADVFRRTGRFDAAIKDYDRCLALNPRYVKCYIGRGNSYSSIGRYQESLKDFERAIKLKPNLADAYNGRGGVYGDMGRLDEAIKDFDKAIQIDPEFAEAYFNRGNAYRMKGDMDAAIENYGMAIKILPSYAEAYGSRGNILDERGEVDAAIKDYDKAIALRPEYTEAYSNRCGALHLKGQIEAAIRDCNKAIDLNPGFAEAYSNRGNAFQSKGRVDEAIRDYDKAIELKPDLAAAYLNRAIALFQTRAYDQAWSDVKRYRELGGTPSPSFLADLARASGRSEEGSARP